MTALASKTDKITRLLLLREMAIRAARKNFWAFCQLLEPGFYTPDRPHLKLLCDTLQALYRGELTNQAGEPVRKLMINLPPRLGKTRTTVNFCKWALGQNVENRIISASYSDEAAVDLSRYTRDGISDVREYEYETVFSDIFPETKVQDGNSSFYKWALAGQFFSFKGVGLGGGVTGKGCNIAIIDDPVKNEAVATNEAELMRIWSWYTGTFISRIEKGAIEIIIMTRWSKKDLCGLNLEIEPEKWHVLRLPAVDEESGSLLCEELLDRAMLDDKIRKMPPFIYRANYCQEPVDIQGRLYHNLRTYTDLPKDAAGNPLCERRYCYVDTADTGTDNTCAIGGVVFRGQFWVTDVYYSDDPMEVTENAVAQMIVAGGYSDTDVESNSGGRGFARNVQRIINERFNRRDISIDWFHQGENKESRILTNSSNVENNVFFPYNWRERWPRFYQDVMEYQSKGKNKHDDAPDALTGVVERMDKRVDMAAFRSEIF